MNDEDILKRIFTAEEIVAYKRVKEFQNKIGIYLENYINLFLPMNDISFVGRKGIREMQLSKP